MASLPQVRRAVLALLRQRRRNTGAVVPLRVTVNADGTWRAGKLTGTWTDDGEAFTDDD